MADSIAPLPSEENKPLETALDKAMRGERPPIQHSSQEEVIPDSQRAEGGKPLETALDKAMRGERPPIQHSSQEEVIQDSQRAEGDLPDYMQMLKGSREAREEQLHKELEATPPVPDIALDDGGKIEEPVWWHGGKPDKQPETGTITTAEQADILLKRVDELTKQVDLLTKALQAGDQERYDKFQDRPREDTPPLEPWEEQHLAGQHAQQKEFAQAVEDERRKYDPTFKETSASLPEGDAVDRKSVV